MEEKDRFPIFAVGGQVDRKTQLLSLCVEAIERNGWRYRREEGKDVLVMQMGLKTKLKECRVVVLCDDRCISVYAVSMVSAGPDVRPTIAEFITRANYGLRIGNFEMDYRDGEVRYKAVLDCLDRLPAPKEVDQVIITPVAMLEKFGDGLAKALFGFGEPEADVQKAKG